MKGPVFLRKFAIFEGFSGLEENLSRLIEGLVKSSGQFEKALTNRRGRGGPERVREKEQSKYLKSAIFHPKFFSFLCDLRVLCG
ncbi:MAG: hypothetical protein M3362_03330 [Acidobacteriota bacterium]|nr:hypothetical protein [Acidobacteriota bacterium]